MCNFKTILLTLGMYSSCLVGNTMAFQAVPSSHGNDTSPLCCYWAKNGYCEDNPQWMIPNCPISCGTQHCQGSDWRACIPHPPASCSAEVSFTPIVEEPVVDRDVSYEDTGPEDLVPESPVDQSNTKEDVCCQLAKQGYCSTEPGWMLPNCPDICGTPGCSVTNLLACVEPNPIVECRPVGRRRVPEAQFGLPTTGNDATVLSLSGLPHPPAGARLYRFESRPHETQSPSNDRKLCCILAQQGFCVSNPAWMLPNCPVECGTPHCTEDNLELCGVANPIAACRPGALQGQDKSEHCCRWAQMGHCNVNPSYMMTQCSRSCGTAGCGAENVSSCLPNPPPECSSASLPGNQATLKR